MQKADVQGHRALLFINNPHVHLYDDPTHFGEGYDILTDPLPPDYTVPRNAKSVEDGDIAVVYRVDAHATKRDPGHIVALARITSSPWYNRQATAVNWQVQLLPPEAWISSDEMKESGLWQDRVPLSDQTQASSPVQLDSDQWAWLRARLLPAAVEWLEDHARGH